MYLSLSYCDCLWLYCSYPRNCIWHCQCSCLTSSCSFSAASFIGVLPYLSWEIFAPRLNNHFTWNSRKWYVWFGFNSIWLCVLNWNWKISINSRSQCGLCWRQSEEAWLRLHRGCSRPHPCKRAVAFSPRFLNGFPTCSRTIHLMQGRQPIWAAAWMGAIPSWARA